MILHANSVMTSSSTGRMPRRYLLATAAKHADIPVSARAWRGLAPTSLGYPNPAATIPFGQLPFLKAAKAICQESHQDVHRSGHGYMHKSINIVYLIVGGLSLNNIFTITSSTTGPTYLGFGYDQDTLPAL